MLAFLLFCLAFAAATLLYVYEGVLAFMALKLWPQAAHSTPAAPAARLPDDAALPKMLVQVPLYNERYVVTGLIDALAKLDYPSAKLTIQILDDSTDDTPEIVEHSVGQVRARGFKVEHIRRENRQGFKAGALAAGMALNDSPFIAIFDADFLPQPTILRQLYAEFDGPDLALVQAAWDHINGEENLATRLMSLAIDDHFSIEQQGRQDMGAWIHFNGTAGLWRREAIIASGGWQSDTLTEDLDLSFRAQAKGWRLKYVDHIKVPCLIPSVMTAIRTQQRRWTKGAAETARKNVKLLIAKEAPFAVKLVDFFHVMNFIMFPAMLVMSLSLALLALVTDAAFTPAYYALVVFLYPLLPLSLLPYFIAGVTRARRDGDHNILLVAFNTFLLLLLIVGISVQNTVSVAEGLMGRKTSFVRTPKTLPGQAPSSLSRTYKYNMPTKVMLLETVVALLMLAFVAELVLTGNWFVVLTALYFFGCYAMVIALSLLELRPAAPRQSH